MENLLNQIRGVVGVAGVMIFDRRSGKSKSLMPASFTEEFAETLNGKFQDLLQVAGLNSTMRIKMGNGWAIIKVINHYAFLVLAKSDLNVSTLNLVLKSIAVSLDQHKGIPGEDPSAAFTPDSAGALLKAINLIGEHFSETISRFRLSELLRKAKAELMEQYQALKLFSVDHNGRVFLIKGSEERLNQSCTDAVAAWMAHLKDYIREDTVIVGFNLRTITSEIQSELDTISFYHAFKKVQQS